MPRRIRVVRCEAGTKSSHGFTRCASSTSTEAWSKKSQRQWRLNPCSTSSSPLRTAPLPSIRIVETEARNIRYAHTQCRICDAMNSSLRKVSGYRLYCLDGVNRVASAEWIEADDDEAAIEIAKEIQDGYECELWQGSRLVARLDLRRKA